MTEPKPAADTHLPPSTPGVAAVATLPATSTPWQTLAHAPLPGTFVGHVDEVPDGQVVMRDVFADTDTDTAQQQQPFKILLLRSGRDIKAFANRCAHFGVPLAAKQAQLKFQPHTSISCNVHYARYRWSDGVCEWGDCEGEALIAIPLQVDAQGQLRIAPSAPAP
jgi:nitrite reductase/ring-hydroxylating ferredoxin subunit